jgi:hypothetical protein
VALRRVDDRNRVQPIPITAIEDRAFRRAA